MKKISILSLHLGFGGIEKAVSILANSLCDKYEVEIACTYRLYEKPGFYINPKVKIIYLNSELKPNKERLKETLKNKKFISFVRESSYSAKVLYYRKKTMIDYIKNCDSDVIISTRDIFNKWLGDYGHSSLKVGWEHNHYHGDMKYANKIIKSVKKLDYLVTVSNSLYEFYSGHLDKCKCIFIPNSIDKISNITSKLNNKRLISVGRLSPEKGQLDLLKMFKKLHDKDSDYSLDIVGDGVLYNDLKKYVIDNDLNDSVKLHGFQGSEYISKLFENSSIFLLTSFTESFGIVLIEAMNYGIPCIAFDSAEGAREVIDNCKNGYLISNRNFDDMIEKIEFLIDNKDIREKMGKCAYKSVAKYSSNVISKEWISLIDGVVLK